VHTPTRYELTTGKNISGLNSAIAAFDFMTPNTGLVVTTGRFTTPARGYVEDSE
jgi:hypothetical protein